MKKVAYLAILFEEGHAPKYEKTDAGLTITLDPSITTVLEAVASLPDVDLTVELLDSYTLPAKIAIEETLRKKLGLPVTGVYNV